MTGESVRLGRVGVWALNGYFSGLDAAEIGALGAAVEDAGYGALWVGMATADLDTAGPILAATRNLVYATGILNVWSEPADKARAAYHRLVADHPNRVLLGVGAGHREITQTYQRPLDAVDGYLDDLTGGPDAVPADRAVLAALGPKMVELAGRRTGGAHPYLTTPEHTARARVALGAGRLLVPEQKVVLVTDADRAREIARGTLELYLGLANYRANFARMGFTADDLADGGSDRFVDALIAHGEPETIAARVRAHLDAGADHVAVQVLADGAGRFPLDELRALAPALLR